MGNMKIRNGWIIGALLAAECGAFFFAGAAAHSALEACREEKTAVIDMGVAGMRYALSAGGKTAEGRVIAGETAEALQEKLPASFTFLRDGDRLVSGAAAGELPFGETETDFHKGDLVYVPSKGRLVIFLADGTEPAGAVRIGEIADVESLTGKETEEITIAMGR